MVWWQQRIPTDRDTDKTKQHTQTWNKQHLNNIPSLHPSSTKWRTRRGKEEAEANIKRGRGRGRRRVVGGGGEGVGWEGKPTTVAEVSAKSFIVSDWATMSKNAILFRLRCLVIPSKLLTTENSDSKYKFRSLRTITSRLGTFFAIVFCFPLSHSSPA